MNWTGMFQITRRKLLGMAAAATAAGFATGKASAASASPIKWKVQSAWPVADWHFVNLKGLAEKIEKMSGGRLQLELLGPGSVVPISDVLDAVSKGLLDGAHSNCGFIWGKQTALALFANAAGGPWGLNAEDFLAWVYLGDGLKLYNEVLQDTMKLNIVVFPTFGETPEPLGWFKKPIKTVADFKGLKFRAAGMAAEVFKEMGMPVASLAPGEIVPALERGTLDASEYSDPTADMSAGFQEVRKVYMMPGIHQPTGLMDVLINKKKFDELPADLKAIVEYASMAETLHFTVKMLDRNSQDLGTLVEKHGVTVYETPRDILTECLKAWDKVADRRAKENPVFAKVLASQKAFAKRLVGFRRVAHPPYDLAADYYWGKENPYKVKKP